MRRARVRNRPGRPGWCFPSPAGSPRFCVSCSPLVCGCARVRLGLLNVPAYDNFVQWPFPVCVAAAASVPPFSPFSRSFLPPGRVGGFRSDSDSALSSRQGSAGGPSRVRRAGQALGLACALGFCARAGGERVSVRPSRLGSGGLSLFQALAI